MGFQAVRNLGFKRVSQIYISYDQSSLAKNNMKLDCSAPVAGNRLPFLQLYNPESRELDSIYHLFDGRALQVLIWLSNTDGIGEKEAQAVRDCFAENDDVQVHTIHNTTENVPAFKKIHAGSSILYIVRPDNYIGYIGKVDDLEGMQDYLKLFFV